MKGQINNSVAQVKVNFMKDEAKVLDAGSKASNRLMRDGTISVVGQITDGRSLTMTFDEGVEDVTAQLVGATVNLRFTAEQFEALNERFHAMNSVGALVQVLVDASVEYGTLTVRGVETESYTIYVESIEDVEPMAIQRVGSRDNRSAVMARLQAHKDQNTNNRNAAIQAGIAARAQLSAATAGANATAPSIVIS